MLLRAAIYARISQTDPEVDAIGDQVQRCTALAERESYTIVAEFSDDGISGWSGKNRPGFLGLTDAIRTESFDVVLAVAEDRFTRSAQEKLGFAADCASRGVTWHTLSGGKVDPSTKEGRLFGTITGGIAEYESALRSDRVAASVQRRLAEGKDLGGRRAFGFEGRRTPTVKEDEAELVRLGHQMILDGASVYAVAKAWDDSGLKPTGKAARWRTQTVRSILIRPRNAGRLVVKGVDYGTPLPRLVSDEEHEEVVAILTDPSRAPRRGPKPERWSASGLVRCGTCGSYLGQTGLRNGKRAFRCAGEGRGTEGVHGTMNAEALERQLAETALMRALTMASEGAPVDAPRAEITAARALLAEKRRQRSLAQEFLLEPGADVSEFRQKIGALGSEIELAQASLDALLLSNEADAARSVASRFIEEHEGFTIMRGLSAWPEWWDMWSELAIPDRQRLLRGLFRSIELLPRDEALAGTTGPFRLRLDGVSYTG